MGTGEPQIRPKPGSSGGAFRIGDRLCEPELNRVSGPEGVCQLEPKVMQVLVALAEADGRLVARDALLETVWTGTFVGEQVLSRAVFELRKAFGDDARNPRVIETIATRGYRIIAPIAPAGAPAGDPAQAAPRASPRTAGHAGWRRTAYAATAILALTLVVALLRGVGGARAPALPGPGPAPADLAVVLPENAPIELSYFQSFDVSGDGRKIAYSGHVGGKRLLYLRHVDRREVTPIPGTEGGYGPFFSPDSQSIGFYAFGELRAVSLADHSVRELVRDATDAQGANWGPDGTIVFARRMLDGLFRVDAGGGPARRLTRLEPGELSHFWPQILPDGRHALFTVWRGAGSARSAIDAVDVDTGERRRVLEGGSFPRWVATGELVYLSGSSLRAVAFDPVRLAVSGASRVVLADPVTYAFSGIPHIALSRNGTLVYASRSDYSARWSLSWVDASGNRRPAFAERMAYATPQLSPDGRRVAATIADGSMDIWLFDPGRGASERLTTDGGSLWPVWTPDGRKVVFSSDRGGPFNLYVTSVDEDVAPVRLTDSPHIQFAGSVSPDGRTVYFAELRPDTRLGIWSVPLDGSEPARPFLDSGADEFRPALSPDGRLMAYASNEAGRWDELGRWDIYVRPLDHLDTRVLVSTDGGTDPTWSRDGRTLFYRQGGQIRSARIHAGRELRVDAPRLELEGIEPPNAVAQLPSYDVAADGRFLVVERGSPGDITQLNVVQDWLRLR